MFLGDDLFMKNAERIIFSTAYFNVWMDSVGYEKAKLFKNNACHTPGHAYLTTTFLTLPLTTSLTLVPDFPP